MSRGSEGAYHTVMAQRIDFAKLQISEIANFGHRASRAEDGGRPRITRVVCACGDSSLAVAAAGTLGAGVPLANDDGPGQADNH